MSELLAVLSNPKRRRRRRRNPIGMHRDRGGRYVPMGGARRRPRRGGTMQSVHRSGGARVSRAAWRRSVYRRNPIGGRGRVMAQGLGQELIAALAGAAGGAALDLVMRPVPLALKAGPLNYLVRGAASIGLGLIAQAVRVPMAAEIARGAMTITTYNALRQYVLVPQGLGELSDDDVAELSQMDYDGMSEVVSLPAYSPQLGEAFEMNGLSAYELDQVYDE